VRLSWLALVVVQTFVARADAAVPTMPPDAVHPGDRVVVHTVFAGATVDSFEAVILGALDAGRSSGVTVFARATSGEALRTGVAQGMSGSPVTVNGRLLGALSSGFAFNKEPIFGITPIGEMLESFAHPDQTKSGDPSTGMAGPDDGPLATMPRWGAYR